MVRTEEISGLQTDLIRTSMDRSAARYVENRWTGSAVRKWDFQMTKDALHRELQPETKDRILEIGCGPGVWSSSVGAVCKSLTAMDISPNMIAEAKKNTAELDVNFICGDFLTSDVVGQFDKVFSVRVLEYIADLPRFAGKVNRLVKPGGRVVLITKPRKSIWRGRTRLLYLSNFKSSNRPKGSATSGQERVIQYPRDPSEIEAEFTKLGFTDVNIVPVITRLPLFRRGFHEFPLVPEFLSRPFLSAFTVAHSMTAHSPNPISKISVMTCESYCISMMAPNG